MAADDSLGGEREEGSEAEAGSEERQAGAAEEEAVDGEGSGAEAEGEPSAEGDPEPEPEEAEPPRRRNPRAAIVVRDDTDAILAALILARDRRSLVSFRVVKQEGLVDFLKGPANDVPEDVDLLIVGFTAEPAPLGVIQTAELFRGRLQWFDHHEWPIEDIERLRDAIGRESILIEQGAGGPLSPVVKVCERRSRFTDKLVDLAAGRLSENDMEKWGYRVVGLVRKLAERTGDHRADLNPILSGKPSELPEPESVFADEAAWVSENRPRVVHFGEYQMVVLRVPPNLDSVEIGRRSRLLTGARLSLMSREDDDLVVLSCNDEKRHINTLGLVDQVSARLPWAEVASGGDRVGRLRIAELSQHPERLEVIVGEIVRKRSVLYG